MTFAKSSSADLRDVFRWEFAREVLLLVWMASVAVCTLVLLVSFLVTPESLDAGALGWLGACPARLAGQPCSLCGMSHSFAAMASGRWADAATFHSFGPVLFLLAVINVASALAARSTRGNQWA